MAEVRTLAEIKLDDAFKFGCNRYLQGQGVLEKAAAEIGRKGKKPYLIAGPRAWDATENRLAASLQAAGMPFELELYSQQNTYEKAKAVAAAAQVAGCDVIVGVGGGRILDLAKASAHYAALPVITVPTSIATCAAYAPLSVMYTEEGASLGSLRFEKEVDAILVDMDVIAKEPARYVASGMLDGMAKLIEIQNGYSNIDTERFSIGLLTSFALAKYTTQIYNERGAQACADVQKGQVTKALEDIAYISIAVTGMISGCSKGFGQSALAHETYELIRTHFTHEAKAFLHGEIVALALPMQLCYNGQDDQILPLRSLMKSMGMPLHLQDIGIAHTPENIEKLFYDLLHSPFMEASAQNEQRLRKAVVYLTQ